MNASICRARRMPKTPPTNTLNLRRYLSFSSDGNCKGGLIHLTEIWAELPRVGAGGGPGPSRGRPTGTSRPPTQGTRKPREPDPLRLRYFPSRSTGQGACRHRGGTVVFVAAAVVVVVDVILVVDVEPTRRLTLRDVAGLCFVPSRVQRYVVPPLFIVSSRSCARTWS